MTQSIGYCALLCFLTLVGVLTAVAPGVLSDANDFLKGFVNHELLNVLGVIVAITLASAAQLHLTLNGIEEQFNRRNAFERTRAGVRRAGTALIVLFVVALVLVVAKPLVAQEAWSQSLFNGVALLILLWNVLLLVALTGAVFAIAPMKADRADERPPPTDTADVPAKLRPRLPEGR